MPPAPPLFSLIMPIWGDDTLAAEQVRRMPLDPGVGEWVIASVEPSELLWEMAERGEIRLAICGKPSRGEQMNQGAALARGRLLCFHHADSEMGPEHIRALTEVAEDPKTIGGAFHRFFDERHPRMRRFQQLSHRLQERGGPLFGDQSIFVRADVFDALGGYALIPLMEDLEFSKRLRKAGSIRLLYPAMWSSPRRFQKIGSWRSSLTNGAFLALFYLGVSPHALHRWYYRGGPSSRGTAAPTSAPSNPPTS